MVKSNPSIFLRSYDSGISESGISLEELNLLDQDWAFSRATWKAFPDSVPNVFDLWNCSESSSELVWAKFWALSRASQCDP